MGIYMSEYLATLVLTLGGNGSTAQWFVSSKVSGTYLLPLLGSALSTTAGICLAARTSGGYLNPAVTVAFAIFERRPPWPVVPGYIISQFLGAFTGSAIVYGVYSGALNDFDGGNRAIFGAKATARIFSTYPMSYMTTLNAFFDVLVGSAFLMLIVYALMDRHNSSYQPHVIILLVGLVSLLIGLCLGWNTGYPLNPAKDFGSRVLSCIFYGSQVFSAYNYYFWIPLVTPFLGTILGAMIYRFFIGFHLEWKATQECPSITATPPSAPLPSSKRPSVGSSL